MNTIRFDGKTALVTGAAGNLGKAVGAAFEAAGANVALVDLDARMLASAWGGGDTNRRALLAADRSS